MSGFCSVGLQLLTCRYGESWLRSFQLEPSLSLYCPIALGSLGQPHLGISGTPFLLLLLKQSVHTIERRYKATAMTGQRDRLVTESSGVFCSFGTKFRIVLE